MADRVRESNLAIGRYLDHPARAVEIPAGEVRRHTAILAQSGSGKSFFLGLLVEELLVRTKAKVVVIDTNGDFRRFRQVSEDPPLWTATARALRLRRENEAFSSIWQGAVRQLHIPADLGACPPEEGATPQVPLVRWTELPFEQRAAIASSAAGHSPGHPRLLADGLRPGCTEEAKAASARSVVGRLNPEFTSPWRFHRQMTEGVRTPELDADCRELEGLLSEVNARLEEWGVWAPSDWLAPDLRTHVLGNGIDWDVLVLDLPSFRHRGARQVLVRTALDAIWDAGVGGWEQAVAPDATDERVPTIVVIDEAHNFAPKDATDGLTGEVSDLIYAIAAEGRKYGLALILATQRPAKVRDGLLAECENVCLLRLQSPVDHKTAADTWGIPMEEVQRTHYFRTGDGMLFGRWVPTATPFHCGRRRTVEGGGNLPDDWLEPRSLPTRPEGEEEDGETLEAQV